MEAPFFEVEEVLTALEADFVELVAAGGLLLGRVHRLVARGALGRLGRLERHDGSISSIELYQASSISISALSRSNNLQSYSSTAAELDMAAPDYCADPRSDLWDQERRI